MAEESGQSGLATRAFPPLRPPESISGRNESGGLRGAVAGTMIGRARPQENRFVSRSISVDDYIARQADFARPILTQLREAVHAACPEAEEALKWGMPAFIYKGEILATMAAFKAHATFGFRRGSLVVGDTGAEREAMGQFGRLASPADLPDPEILAELIRKAVALADAGVKPVRNQTARAALVVPEDLRAALAADPAAATVFDGFSPGAQREYTEWIAQAKQPATRERRIAQAVEWIAQGKKRNWKYEKC